MVVFLLLVIIFILLFGAAAVQGWIGSILCQGLIILGLAAIFAVAIFTFGSENFPIVLLSFAAAYIGLGVCLHINWLRFMPRGKRRGPPTTYVEAIGKAFRKWKAERSEERIRRDRAKLKVAPPKPLSKEEKKG